MLCGVYEGGGEVCVICGVWERCVWCLCECAVYVGGWEEGVCGMCVVYVCGVVCVWCVCVWGGVVCV